MLSRLLKCSLDLGRRSCRLALFFDLPYVLDLVGAGTSLAARESAIHKVNQAPADLASHEGILRQGPGLRYPAGHNERPAL